LGGSSPTRRIAEAIERLRNNFDQPLCLEDLAQELGMSVSGFHQHF
jgi:AraC-like DNA-binding protein